MDDQLSHLVLLICERGGRASVDLAALSGYVSRTGGYRPPFAEVQDKRGRRWTTLDVAGLRLCDDHCTGDGCEGECAALHICKYFILGKCTRRADNCDFGHNLRSSHNSPVLRNYGLHEASLEAIQAIMKLYRTKQTLPTACNFYNQENGCRKPTEGRNACTFLHVCRFFLENDCKFGSGCKRNHDLTNNHARTILEHYGLTGRNNDELLRHFRTNKEMSAGNRLRSSSSLSYEPPVDRRQENHVRRRSASSEQASSYSGACASVANTAAKPLGKSFTESDNNRPPQICMYNLMGKCFYGTKCRNYHSDLPYQWQIKSKKWQDCSPDLNSMLEKNYCKLNTTSALLSGNTKVNYEQMTLDLNSQVFDLRRLETVSNVVSDTWLFATEWLWYFEDSNGHWTEYGHEGFSGTKTTEGSPKIEKCYQNYLEGKHDSKLQLQTSKFTYVLNFRKFTQKNLMTKVKRDVFRRPSLYITQPKMEDMKKQRRSSSSGVVFPIEWTRTPSSNNDCFQLGEVLMDSPEYYKVVALFRQTFPSAIAKKVERIQNPNIWEEYFRMKEKMKTKKQDKAVDERLLFHGTGEENLSAICQQGFDPRVAGLSSGTAYGCGAYFSSSAKYSSRYSKTSGKMIVASVLVGDFAVGQPSFRRPPPRDPSRPFGDLYDSVVNDPQSPTIFVIFDPRQMYPNYIVHYNSM